MHRSSWERRLCTITQTQELGDCHRSVRLTVEGERDTYPIAGIEMCPACIIPNVLTPDRSSNNERLPLCTDANFASESACCRICLGMRVDRHSARSLAYNTDRYMAFLVRITSCGSLRNCFCIWSNNILSSARLVGPHDRDISTTRNTTR